MKRINSKVSNLLPQFCKVLFVLFKAIHILYPIRCHIWMTLREKSALQGQRVLGEPPVYRFMPKGDYARKGLCQKGTMICQKGIMPNRGCQIGRCQIGDAKRGLCQILVCQITAQPSRLPTYPTQTNVDIWLTTHPPLLVYVIIECPQI